MPSQIEQRYGVPLPIDVLWRELETRYGLGVVVELHGVYQTAMRRYGRASTLNKWRRLLAHYDRGTTTWKPHPDRLAVWRAALADPQAYIDEKL